MTRIHGASANISFLLSLGALLMSACGTGSEADTERSGSADRAQSTAGTGGASNAGVTAGNATTYNPGTGAAAAAAAAAGSSASAGASSSGTQSSEDDAEASGADPEASDAEGTPPRDGNTSNPGGAPGETSTPGGTPAGDEEPSDEDSDPVSSGSGTAPSLGSASRFAILGTSTVTCTNASAVGGDVGVSPGIAITGFDASCTLTGGLHAKDAIADAAHADLLSAFDGLAASACEHDLTGQELGGQTLPPGVYCFDTTAGITGELTLDAGGDADGVWIFQLGTALTTATGSRVTMAGGADPCNVFWRVGSSATLGTTSSMQGNVLAGASITLTSGSSLVGRAMAVTAAVTSDNNAVSGCAR